MKHYFIHDGKNQLGPFEKLELIEKLIKPETPIWHEGLTDWTTADKLPELSDLFVVKPPPFKKLESTEEIDKTEKDKNTTTPPKLPETEEAKKSETNKKFKLGLFHYLAIIGIIIFVIISYTIYDKSKDEVATVNETLSATQRNLEKEKEELRKAEDEKQRVLNEQNSPDKLRENLIAKERESPNEYLKTINETMQENITRQPDLFHHTERDGYWVRGYIRNTATLATFKDIVIIIKYSTETNTHISDDVFTISKYLRPQTSIPFEHLCHPPQGFVNNWTCEVKDATPN